MVSKTSIPNFDEDVWRFVPPILLADPNFGTQIEHHAAVLFLDVAGFTKLSEELATRAGQEGAEILDQAISGYFDALLVTIERHCGHIIKLSGDAMTVIFPTDAAGLSDAVCHAIRCASEMCQAPQSHRFEPGAVSCNLTHKIGVGAGALLVGFVGDPRNRSEFVFVGGAIDQAAEAEHRAKPGEAWLSPAAAARVADRTWLESTDSDGFARIDQKRQSTSIDSARPAAEPLSLQSYPEQYLDRLLELIPQVVRDHNVDRTLRFLSHHQRLTVMFAGFPNLNLNEPESLHRLDAHYRQMQQIIDQFGGFLSEFEAGDKRAKLIVLFGAPTRLEDPCSQAVACARAMQHAARELGMVDDQRIGLSTGRLYVGRIGCRTMAKYSALGDRMNVAARLMSEAGRWSVLVDQPTFGQSSQSFAWGTPREVLLKGKHIPVTVRTLHVSFAGHGQERRGRGIIGRHSERQLFKRALESLKAGCGTFINLVGAAGLGKTRLIETMRRMSCEAGLRAPTMWNGTVSPVGAPLRVWRSLLLDLLDADEHTTQPTLQDKFLKWSPTLTPELQLAASRIAALLNLGHYSDPTLSQLPPERRIVLQQQAMLDLLSNGLDPQARVILLDDADQMDKPSADVLQEFMPALATLPVIVVAASRREVLPPHFHSETYRYRDHIHVIQLDIFRPSEANRFAARSLKARRLDKELEEFLHSRSQGNPLLIEGWLDVLREHRSIRVINDVAFLFDLPSAEALPDRLEALVLIQLQRLAPSAQLTVRTASVIGHYMTPAEVTALHPMGLSESLVSTHMRLASHADILWYDRSNAPRMFFSRPEVLEAIHESLPFKLRHELHLQRAQQIQARLTGEPIGDVAIALARHYRYIPDPPKQLEAFRRAVSVSVDRYDHEGTVNWSRLYIESGDRINEPDALLEVAGSLNNALSATAAREAQLTFLELWITRATHVNDRVAQSQALLGTAIALQRLNQMDAALDNLHQAIELTRSLDGPTLALDTLTAAAVVLCESGMHEKSLELTTRALERWADLGQARPLFRLYQSHGMGLFQANRKTEAYQSWIKALSYCRATGDLWEEAVVLGNLGILLWSLDSPESGHTFFEQSLELKRQLGNRREVAMGLLNLGYSWLRLGELGRAKSCTQEALLTFRRLGHVRNEQICLSNLGEIFWLLGSFVEAGSCFQQITDMSGVKLLPENQIEFWIRVGELQLSQHQLDRASVEFERAVNACADLVHTAQTCQAVAGLAEVRRQQGRLEEAESLMDQALDELEREPESVMFPQRVWLRAALIARQQARLPQYRAYLNQARTLMEREKRRLGTQLARHRTIRAFQWNKEIKRLHKSQSVESSAV